MISKIFPKGHEIDVQYKLAEDGPVEYVITHKGSDQDKKYFLFHVENDNITQISTSVSADTLDKKVWDSVK